MKFEIFRSFAGPTERTEYWHRQYKQWLPLPLCGKAPEASLYPTHLGALRAFNQLRADFNRIAQSGDRIGFKIAEE